MPSLKQILFPVDFSAKCRAVAPAVRALTAHFDGQLTLLHSLGIPPDASMAYSSSSALSLALMAERQQSSAASMSVFVAQEFGSISVRPVILEGDPAQVIVDYAQKTDVDLIMMPTHGYGRFRSFLIGSVAAKVLHDAHCPVWTSAHQDSGSIAASHGYQTILCAVDSGESSVHLMQWAAWLAGCYGAALKLVHVIPAVDEASANCGEVEVRRYLYGRAREEFAKRIQEAGVQAELRIRGGGIAGAVAETALQERADLLVIGRGRIQRTLGGLRTHSLAVLKGAPCPVISL